MRTPQCHHCVAIHVPKYNAIVSADLSCMQRHYPDSHMDPRSNRGRSVAAGVGLIKFTPTNKGMTYPIIQPSERGLCFPAPSRKHTNLIITALLASITVLVATQVVCCRLWKGKGTRDWWAGSVGFICPTGSSWGVSTKVQEGRGNTCWVWIDTVHWLGSFPGVCRDSVWATD